MINAEDTGSFLTKTFAFCLVNIKSKFDNYVVSRVFCFFEKFFLEDLSPFCGAADTPVLDFW